MNGAPSKEVLERARRNGVAKTLGAGVTAEIRKMLAKHGRCSKGRLIYLTGFTENQVANALGQMCSRFGSAQPVEGSRPRQYELVGEAGFVATRRKTAKNGSGVFAGRITIGRGSRWWAGAGFM